MCVRVFSVGFGPGLDSMSPARSRRSASHAAGSHGWLPQKTGRPGLRRGGVGGYNLHSVPPTVAQSYISSQTISWDAKPIQHRETTHPYVNLKLAFHKVASSHPHYLTFTLQTYHHPEHRFRSWPRRRHHNHIYTQKQGCSKEIHT